MDVWLDDLDRGISAAVQDQSHVGAEETGAVDAFLEGPNEGRGFGFVPEVLH